MHLTATQARAFALHALGLVEPHPTVAAALDHHGYIQIDPINVCGRMPEHLLRNRVAGYREGDLFRHLYGPDETAAPLPPAARTGFEQFLPGAGILVAFPLSAWPHLRPSMEAYATRPGAWSGRLDARQRALAAQLFERLADGPVSSDDIARTAPASNGWGARVSLAKSTLDKLFFHGRVLITRRAHYRRVYDLPERVLPAPLLAQPTPAADETARWRVLTRLRQRRLATLRRADLPLVADLVQPVRVPDCPPLFILRDDLPLLEAVGAGTAPPPPAAPRLLAPLDPLLYDRPLTRRLWSFDYTWEVYTPPAQRVRGYYALPVLAGDQLVGHVDLKADRTAGRLRVVSRRVARGHAAAPAVRELARFLGLR